VTTIVPVMNGWIEQKYLIVPAVESLTEYLAPGLIVGEEANFGPLT
jgi:hypothetical protein